MLLNLIIHIFRSRYLNSIEYICLICFNKLVKYISNFKIMDLLKKSNNDITSTTTIVFKADDKVHCYETDKSNVVVIGSTGDHDHGSSKVKLKNIVDYKWEIKNYPARLIAVHLDGRHIAYVIKSPTKEGMVRVANVSGHRALIKGMTSEVLDLEFANLKDNLILGCIEKTAVHIHKIENLPDKILCTLMIKIEDPLADVSIINAKISWCPYMPDNENDIDEYAGQQIVWIRGNTYQCYSVRAIVDSYGVGIHSASNITEGSLKHKETSTITCAAYSPDGTTLSVSCEDGHIRFYQTYFHTNDSNPRRIHDWIPHGGKPISNVFFLDNHVKSMAGNSLWKHAITTCDNNTELKVWCCSTWKCLQTIQFKSTAQRLLTLKAEIDRTSSYLVLSDIKNRGLYVLQIVKDSDQDESDMVKMKNRITISKTNDDSIGSEYSTLTLAYIKSISEFPLSSPILSFGIVDACVRKYKCAFNDSYLIEELDDYDEDNHSLICVVIHMFIVQPKSVQECHVLYQPTVSTQTEIGSSISADSIKDASANDSIELKKNDSDQLLSTSGAAAASSTTPSSVSIITSPKNIKIENSAVHQNLVNTQPKQVTQINLVTPDSFNSPGKITPEGVSTEVLSTLRMLAKVPQISPDVRQKPSSNVGEGKNVLHLANNNVTEDPEHQRIRQSAEIVTQKLVPPIQTATMLAQTSGGSSPSREVQEILSLKDFDFSNEFADDSNEMLDDNDGESLEIKLNTDEPHSFNDNTSKDEINKSKSAGKHVINSKGDWPKVPQAPSMSSCSKYNNINGSSTNLINELNYKMDLLLDTIQSQTCQISEMKNEMMEMQKKSISDSHKLDALAKNIEFRLSKLIEEYLVRYEREHNKKIEAFVNVRDNQFRELRDHLMHTINQVLLSQINERLSSIILNEHQRHILPLISTKMDAIKVQIHNDVGQQLLICDQLLKDNITKMCSSKETMEQFGNAILMGVQTGFQKTYTESLKKILIPAYEKSSEEMFKQIQDVFLQGTKSYVKQFDAYISQYQPLHEEIIGLLNNMPEQLKSITSSSMVNCTAQMHSDIAKDLRALQVNLTKSLKDNIKNEIQKGFEAQAGTIEESVLSVVRSQAQTPAPSIFDVQEQIKQLLSQGQINTAFHQALVANDLNLVEFTLEKADFNLVFNPCPLQPTVLLSLIQQISADMSNHNEMKQKYLADAIISLDFSDATTKEHGPQIMRELYQNCQNFIAQNSNSSLNSSIKMLMMATQGLGIKIF